MPRSTGIHPPKYRRIGNRAIVTINRRDIPLGPYGSPESRQRYQRAIFEKWGKQQSGPIVPKSPTGFTISEMVNFYKEEAARRYSKNGKLTQEFKACSRVLDFIQDTYGDLVCTEFDSVQLDDYRDALIRQGKTRSTICRYVGYIRRMFRFCAKKKVIPISCKHEIETLDRLEMKSQAPKATRLVPDELFLKTQEKMSQVVRDLVAVHILTGMRGKEVREMRPVEIDTTSRKGLWVYTPHDHKNAHKGESRTILLGANAQSILLPYMSRDPLDFIFKPSESYKQYQERRREARETPLSCGNIPRPHKPRKFRPFYSGDGYRQAIEYATLAAYPYPSDIKGDVEREKIWKQLHKWNPKQLRVTAATKAAIECDMKTAQALLGHKSITTTEKWYVRQGLTEAVDFALKFG